MRHLTLSGQQSWLTLALPMQLWIALTFTSQRLRLWTMSNYMVTLDIIHLFTCTARQETRVPGFSGEMRCQLQPLEIRDSTLLWILTSKQKACQLQADLGLCDHFSLLNFFSETFKLSINHWENFFCISIFSHHICKAVILKNLLPKLLFSKRTHHHWFLSSPKILH